MLTHVQFRCVVGLGRCGRHTSPAQIIAGREHLKLPDQAVTVPSLATNARPMMDAVKRLEHAMNEFDQPMTTPMVGTDSSGLPTNISVRRQDFRPLHEAGCFVIPNPWDVGSARYLQHLGFPALATTSAGFAFSQGLPDSEVALPRDRNLTYIADIAAAADVPVNGPVSRVQRRR